MPFMVPLLILGSAILLTEIASSVNAASPQLIRRPSPQQMSLSQSLSPNPSGSISPAGQRRGGSDSASIRADSASISAVPISAGPISAAVAEFEPLIEFGPVNIHESLNTPESRAPAETTNDDERPPSPDCVIQFPDSKSQTDSDVDSEAEIRDTTAEPTMQRGTSIIENMNQNSNKNPNISDTAQKPECNDNKKSKSDALVTKPDPVGNFLSSVLTLLGCNVKDCPSGSKKENTSSEKASPRHRSEYVGTPSPYQRPSKADIVNNNDKNIKDLLQKNRKIAFRNSSRDEKGPMGKRAAESKHLAFEHKRKLEMLMAEARSKILAKIHASSQSPGVLQKMTRSENGVETAIQEAFDLLRQQRMLSAGPPRQLLTKNEVDMRACRFDHTGKAWCGSILPPPPAFSSLVPRGPRNARSFERRREPVAGEPERNPCRARHNLLNKKNRNWNILKRQNIHLVNSDDMTTKESQIEEEEGSQISEEETQIAEGTSEEKDHDDDR